MITSEQRKALVLTRIKQAEDCIADAEYCMVGERHAMAANRIYYGMFYAMLALGLMHEFKTSKHQQMIGWFNKNFVHTGIFPKGFSRLIKNAFDLRSKVDYDVVPVPTAANLEAMFVDMKLFISTIKAWIEEQLRKD